MFDYWKPLLTDYFIEEIKNCGGVDVYKRQVHGQVRTSVQKVLIEINFVSLAAIIEFVIIPG